MTSFEDRLRAHLETEWDAVPPLRPAGASPQPVERLGGLGRWMLGAAAAVLVMVTVVGAMRWPASRPPAAGVTEASPVLIAGHEVAVSGSVAWAGGTVHVGVPSADPGPARPEGEPQELVPAASLSLEDLSGLDLATAVYLGNLPSGDPVIISDYDPGRSVLGWLGGVFGRSAGDGWCLLVGNAALTVTCQENSTLVQVGDPNMAMDGFRSVVGWGSVPAGTVTVELVEAQSERVIHWQTPVSGAVVFEVSSIGGPELGLRALDASGTMLEAIDVGAVDLADGVTTTITEVQTTWGADTTAPFGTTSP